LPQPSARHVAQATSDPGHSVVSSTTTPSPQAFSSIADAVSTSSTMRGEITSAPAGVTGPAMNANTRAAHDFAMPWDWASS
jgi:hypothetical protein